MPNKAIKRLRLFNSVKRDKSAKWINTKEEP